MCMSRTGLFIHFVIPLRVDQPYMATMVYHGIFLIYHSLPWYIRYIPQLKALMLPTQSGICYSYITSMSRISLLLHETEGEAQGRVLITMISYKCL